MIIFWILFFKNIEKNWDTSFSWFNILNSLRMKIDFSFEISTWTRFKFVSASEHFGGKSLLSIFFFSCTINQIGIWLGWQSLSILLYLNKRIMSKNNLLFFLSSQCVFRKFTYTWTIIGKSSLFHQGRTQRIFYQKTKFCNF